MSVVPVMPAIPANDPYAAMIAQLIAQVRAVEANQAQAQDGRPYADDSDEELEAFAPHISNIPFPLGFKLPHVSSYDGTTDHGNHLSTFNVVMKASNVNTELMCMLFPTSLTGSAKSWFDKFKRHSITSWEQLSSEFKKRFRAARTIKLEASSLANIKRKAGETLNQYMARFSLEATQARGVDDSRHLMAIRVGILPASAF